MKPRPPAWVDRAVLVVLHTKRRPACLWGHPVNVPLSKVQQTLTIFVELSNSSRQGFCGTGRWTLAPWRDPDTQVPLGSPCQLGSVAPQPGGIGEQLPLCVRRWQVTTATGSERVRALPGDVAACMGRQDHPGKALVSTNHFPPRTSSQRG